MNKVILSFKDISFLVKENRYRVNPKTWFLSRCIDGRYKNSSDLEALALPGADLGEISIVVAACLTYGYDYDLEKIMAVFVDVVGDEDSLRTHTDSHGDKNIYASGCGHFAQITKDPKAYGLNEFLVEEIRKLFTSKFKNQLGGKSYIVLSGDHLEGAVLVIEGDWGIYPQYVLETNEGKKPVQVFVYHKTLVERRRRLMAKKLLEKKAIVFRNGENEEMLYQALNEVGEDHFFETAKRLAKDLFIYQVVFQGNGDFKIKEQGVVSLNELKKHCF